MNKLKNKIKNWWNPLSCRKELSFLSWMFVPKVDITAYELYRCQRQPMCIGIKNTAEYKLKMDNWYNDLPDGCKRHLIPFQQICIEMCNYE